MNPQKHNKVWKKIRKLPEEMQEPMCQTLHASKYSTIHEVLETRRFNISNDIAIGDMHTPEYHTVHCPG